MGMFNKYYYTRQGENHIIYTINTLDEGLKLSLYQNEALVDQTIGVMGDFLLQGDDIKLSIKNTALKSKHTLTYKGHEVEMKSISLRKLKELLKMARINNALNPIKEEGKSTKTLYKVLGIFALLAVALVIHYFIRDMDKVYELIAVVPEAIAGLIFYNIAAKKVDWFRTYRKARFGFILLMVVGISLLAEFIF